MKECKYIKSKTRTSAFDINKQPSEWIKQIIPYLRERLPISLKILATMSQGIEYTYIC